jgi:predicted RNA-binding Zn-ribbon protein involved in translation (DUF1610 family)
MGLFGFFPVQEAKPVPSRSDFSRETYRCIACGGELTIRSVENLRPCPGCSNSTWKFTAASLRAKSETFAR